MKKTVVFCVFCAVFSLLMATCLDKARAATTWYVYNPYSGFDHANAADSRSIAYALANANIYDTIKLVEGENYTINSPLHVKKANVLQGILPTGGQKLIPSIGFPAESPMLYIYSGVSNTYPTTIKNLHVDGLWVAWKCIHGVSASNYLKIEGCIVRNTKYNHSAGDPRLNLITFYQNSNVVVRNCEVKYAGCHPTFGRVGTGWTGQAAGISATLCVGVTVDNCFINHVLTAGVDITNSRNVWVAYSEIDNVGLNRYYGMPAADGVTGYSNVSILGYDSYQINIYENIITNSGNHGIHVSGKGIVIRDNIIDTVEGQGILLYDQYYKDLTTNCVISDNSISNVLHPELNGHDVYIRWYKLSTITQYGNGPDVVWYEGLP